MRDSPLPPNYQQGKNSYLRLPDGDLQTTDYDWHGQVIEGNYVQRAAAEEDRSRAKQQNQSVMLTVSHRWNLGY